MNVKTALMPRQDAAEEAEDIVRCQMSIKEDIETIEEELRKAYLMDEEFMPGLPFVQVTEDDGEARLLYLGIGEARLKISMESLEDGKMVREVFLGDLALEKDINYKVVTLALWHIPDLMHKIAMAKSRRICG